MLRFENDEIGFEVPDGWSDLSTTSYVLPELASNLTLTRSPVHSTATLAECQRDVLAALVATFPEIEIVERAVADDVVRLVVEWTCELGSLRQLVALALADGELWSLTASTPTIFRARSESQIDRAMRSFGRCASKANTEASEVSAR